MNYSLKIFDKDYNRVMFTVGRCYDQLVEHGHNFVEIVYVANGYGRSIVDKVTSYVQKGDLFILSNPNQQHSAHPMCQDKDFTLNNILVPFDMFDIDWNQFEGNKIYRASDINGFDSILEIIKREENEKGPYFKNIMQNAVSTLLYQIMRLKPQKSKEKKARTDDNYVLFASEFIKNNYEKPLTVADVAKDCGISVQYLKKKFHEIRNQTVKQYLISYRIEQSCIKLIETDMKINEIALSVGFNDLKYFFLTFKKIMKTTPTQFRAKNKLGGN